MPPPAPALNDRQRAYLLAVFETDQETEQQVRELPYRPFQPPRPKASEWRWLEYAEPVPILGREGSPLWTRIKKLGLVDQGTGSTFSALADRHLVEVRWHHLNVHGQGTPHLRMTTKGRQLARSWTGVKAYKAPPAGSSRTQRRRREGSRCDRANGRRPRRLPLVRRALTRTGARAPTLGMLPR